MENLKTKLNEARESIYLTIFSPGTLPISLELADTLDAIDKLQKAIEQLEIEQNLVK